MTMTSSSVGPSRGQGLLSVHKPSTLLPPSPPLRRFLMSLDKSHLIQVALYWIDQALTAPSSDIVPPQLSRRPPRRQEARRGDIDDAPGQDGGKGASYDHEVEDATTTASFLDLYEDRRARSYEELRTLWSQIMPEARVARTRAVDRIVDVDWPQGISFGMAATVAFEICRASPRGRNWTAMSFDFGTVKAKAAASDAKDDAASKNTSVYLQRLKSMSSTTFADLFSAELRHYCSHALFIEKPVESKVQQDVKLDDDDGIAPLPEHWAAPFTHIRVVTCDNAADVCSIGLHILHLPQSPWCLVSGNLGRNGTEVREMALNALANAVGARCMQMPSKGSSTREGVATTTKLGELKGRDPLSLREVLIGAGLVDDNGETGGAILGGKGRRMRKGDAEDGPLTRPEKRQREDKSGLYAEAEGQAHDPNSRDANDDAKDLTELKDLRRQRAARRKARQREVEDLFGQAVDVAGDADLPRIEKIQYDLFLPFNSAPTTRGELVPDSIVQQHPITMRLEGTHVLAGLRKLVQGGLDKQYEQDGSAHTDKTRGLPLWLVEVRGTRVRIGAPAVTEDDDIDFDSLDDEVEEEQEERRQSNEPSGEDEE